MKIVLTGSLGHINQTLVPLLGRAGHQVTVISHDAKRSALIKAFRGIPAIGSIDDVDFLTETFKGADVVYLMLTGITAAPDIYAAAQKQADIYVQAVKAAGVKRVVNLSSIGANLGPEVGSLYMYNLIEKTLTTGLPDVDLTFIRPTGMYYNLLSSLASVKQLHAIYTNANLLTVNSWVAPIDVTRVLIKALTEPVAGVTMQYVASDEKTYAEVATALSQSLQMPDLKVVQITDEAMTENLVTAGVPAAFANEYVKTVAYQRDHNFAADYQAHHPKLGDVKLADFAQVFAEAYRSGQQG
ncbi:SDR family oxidoreductase [Lactiplantibacillus herbarum]|uniref:SDR family oxidoreductase n=1 Tax=Lactiplantibacillus herbarum TaxID=1670446 RepID=UPI00064FA5AA|nr:NAD(P)H-binding protein [Lactiplantibacillus herbarum]